MRRLPFLATLLGVILLAAGLMATAFATAQERKQQATLKRDSAQVASSFGSYFERARSLDLLLAQNQTFAVTSHNTTERAAANSALRYLEVLYPGSIGEACMIDEQGRELARVTGGRQAPAGDLSASEKQNLFFAPTLALSLGRVYQAAPYISPDTHTWVISNSTWIRLADRSRMIVHFEVSLASFGQYLGNSSTNQHASIFNGSTGEIFLQDRTALRPPDATAGFPVTNWSSAYSTRSAATSVAPIDGRNGVIQRIDRMNGNANDWYVAEWDTARASLIPAWAGFAATGLGVLLIILALMSLRRQQSTLRAAASIDHLTGLANRKALQEALVRALGSDGNPARDRVAVLMLDLDGFKQVNDVLGHEKGDLVLQEVARRLHANVFEYDTAARLGGDEFAVVLRRVREADDVAVVAQRLREALIRPIELDGVPHFVGVSIGAAAYPEHGTIPAVLLRNADAAMYQAKRGREGVRVYDAGNVAGVAALGLAAELQTAIDHGDIELAFQPLISLATGQTTGVEALARWHRPGYGPVPPSQFIPLAEETGLIRPLTQLTLRRALDEAQIWHDSGIHVPVSVNLSGQMAADSSLPADIAALLHERGLEGNALVIEITETAIIGNHKAAAKVLQRLRQKGIRIELDDFGSGYASFGALQSLPLDGIKLDQTLVSDQNLGETRLLAATVEMARRLGLDVVAEGIENIETLTLVREIGCDTAQGYHLGRPMPPDAIRALLGCQRVAAANSAI